MDQDVTVRILLHDSERVWGPFRFGAEWCSAGFDYSQRAAKPRDLLREVGEADQDVELTWHEIAGSG